MRYSELSTYQQCPRKYKYAYLDNLEKIEKTESEHDKTWGQAVHKGLELYYKGYGWEEIKKEFSQLYPRQLKEDDLAKTPESGLWILKEYINYYQTIDKTNWKILSVEHEDSFKFMGIEWGVHIDLIAENLQGGGIYFWDHKTTGRTPSFSFWKRFELNSQMFAYTAYIQERYGQCSGAIINTLVVGHRLRAYKGEPAGHWFKFERNTFNYYPRQVEEWKRNVVEWNFQIETAKIFPLHESILCDYCEFRELCLSCHDEQVLNTLYKIKEHQNGTSETDSEEPA